MRAFATSFDRAGELIRHLVDPESDTTPEARKKGARGRLFFVLGLEFEDQGCALGGPHRQVRERTGTQFVVSLMLLFASVSCGGFVTVVPGEEEP